LNPQSAKTSGVVYYLVVLMLLIWGGNYIAAKMVFREIPANLVICLRTMIAGLLIIPIYWVEARKRPPVLTWAEFRLLATLGLGGITVNQVFWTLGMSRTTVVHSSMIMATTPLWVLLIAALMGMEKITVFKATGMGIAMTGVVLLQVLRARGSATTSNAEATLLGDFYVLICALALAGMTAWGKRYKPLSGGIAVNLVGYVGGAIVLSPLLPFAANGFVFSKVSTTAWLCLLYMGAMSSVAGYLIYLYALARMPASRIATFQYLQPVFASGLAVLLLNEHLGAGALAAGAVIFTGVFITERFG
jgi:drug/metabolite transporter (DMT)-like permease